MSARLSRALLLVSLSLVASPVSAQPEAAGRKPSGQPPEGLRPAASIRHPDGQLPTDVVLYPRSKIPRPVWLAYEGFQPRVLPDSKSAPANPSAKFSFMEPFYFADTRNEEDYHLLVTVGPNNKVKDYVGWVPGRYLARESAIKTQDTLITLKALVVNKRASLAQFDQLLIRSRPSKDAPGKDEPQRLYTTLFVYAQADGHVLVGDEPSFLPARTEDATRVVLGWLPQERTEIWNTREAAEWDHEATLEPKDRPRLAINSPPSAGPKRRTIPGRIYASPEQALKGLTDPSVAALFEEQDFEPDSKLGYKVSPELPDDAPRFPVLRTVPGARHPRAGDLFEVGGIGGLVDAQGKVLLTAGQVKRWQDRLKALQDQVTRTDILFVIDDTESMEKWFGAAAATVRKITDLANRESHRQVRVAVTFYNDVTEQSKREKRPPVQAAVLQDARNKGLEIAQMLEERQRKKDVRGGGDPHEMVFRGIVEGIDKANFHPQARKLVVVIGDCGDLTASKKRKQEDPEYANYTKKYNVQEIVERLVPDNLEKDAPIEFYAVQVIDPADNVAAGDFQTQMNEIKKQYGERLLERKKKQLAEKFNPSAFRVTAGYFDPAAAGGTSVVDALNGQYERLAQEVRAMEDQMKRARRGQWLTTKFTPEVEQQIDRQLSELSGGKVNLDTLRRSGGLQLFQVGYVYQNNSAALPQLRKRLLLHAGELKQLVNLLNDLAAEGTQELPREVVAGFIEKQANTDDRNDPDRLKNKSLKDLLKNSNGLNFKHSLMTKKLAELRDKDAMLDDTEYWALLHVRDLLVDVRDGQVRQYKAREGMRAGLTWTEYLPHGDPVRKQRGFKMSDRDALLWYYIDYEKEWP